MTVSVNRLKLEDWIPKKSLAQIQWDYNQKVSLDLLKVPQPKEGELELPEEDDEDEEPQGF